jgi:hypothetical protein
MDDPVAPPEITSDEKTMAALVHVLPPVAGGSLR